MGMSDYFIFDDIDTRNFENVYVSFDNVDRSPKRVYQAVNIAGRNGAFYIDEGRYEDVEHVYHIAALSKEAGSNLINALSSKVGHYRLEDSFNSDEFYSAVFTSGAEPKISSTRDKNTFKVTFTRKPQRWLKSGETAVTVSSGGTINNPTLFEAKPVIKFRGYGDIVLSGQTIAVDQITVGKVLLANGRRTSLEYPTNALATLEPVISYTIDTNSLNTGDDIVLGLSSFTYTITATYYSDQMYVATATSQTGTGVSTTATVQTDKTASFYTEFEPITFKTGTSKTVSTTYSMHYEYGTSGGRTSATGNKTVQIAYNGSNTITVSATQEDSSGSRAVFGSCTLGTTTGYSTVSASGDITIDLDTGESYWVKNNKKISADNSIRMGARLPVLVSGTNTITYDNTITNFKVTPNWWRV